MVGLFFLGYRIGGAISTHPVVPFVVGALTYFLVFPRIKAVLVRYPPGYFGNYLRWLSTKDLYYPLPDDQVNPILVSPRESTEAKEPEAKEPEELSRATPVNA